MKTPFSITSRNFSSSKPTYLSQPLGFRFMREVKRTQEVKINTLHNEKPSQSI